VRNLFDNMRAIKRGMSGHFNALRQQCPISHAQLELLITIESGQPISFKQLARQLYLTPGAVSQLAEDLETGTYISREADANDRRVQYLRVTPAGRELLQRIEKGRERVMRDIIADLSDEELAVWLRVQEKMLHHFQSEPNQQTKSE